MIQSRSLTTALVGICVAFLCGRAFGQASGVPAFEIADVHPSPERLHPEMRGGLVPPDHYHLRDATMIDLISTAYSVDPGSVSTNAPWVEFDRFDIYAKAPSRISDAEARLMLRALLADRFKLVVSTGVKPLPAFVLSAGKTPKLKQAAASEEPGGCKYQPPAKGDAPGLVNGVNFACRNVTMQAFADFLHEVASPYLTRPVVDSTGLNGSWDFDLQWSYQMSKDASGVTIFQAVDKQLGLKLESKPAPLPVVAVESMIERPTANVADIEKILPPAPPAQFEVAVIHRANPEEKHFNIDMDPSGRVTIQHASLLTLIYQSFDIGPGKILNKPKFLDEDLWDISGKASTDSAPPLPGAASDLYIDDIKEMIRSLLTERFNLKTHSDVQPADVFALTAPNPKMKKADPANHPVCKDGPGPDGKDPRIENPQLTRLISCQNITMAQFAAEIHTLAGGYLPVPVIDSTGLAGAYDFSLSFTGKGKLNTASASPSGDSGGASDPSGTVTLFDAVQKQLGLKLEKRDKVPQPVLVIDHIEEMPTEN
jgi:uncharacterized protein (TIGR03435 family)